MDHLTFEIAQVTHGSHVTTSLGLLVNGRRLEDLAREVELVEAAADGEEALAGTYTSLTLDDIGADPTHFMGRPRASWFEDGDTVLLGCECGAWGCWPLTAIVEIDEETVVWRHFRHGHRDWDYGALGPFRFARAAYERSLDALG